MKSGRKLLSIMAWGVLVAVYVLMVGIFAAYGSHNLNADDSSEMVYAAQMNEEGSLHTENWLYSTELRVVSPVQLYQLGLKIFPDNWSAARAFAQALSMLGIAACVLLFARILGLGMHAPLLATAFLLPFSFDYMYIMLFGCHYAVHLMISLIVLCLVMRFGGRTVRHAGASLALLVFLGLWSGLSGLRMLTMLVAPLCAASVILALLACRNHACAAEAAQDPAVRMAGAALLNTLAAAVGYVLNVKVFGPHFSYPTYSDLQMGRLNVLDFANQLNGIIRTFGYRDQVPLFSIRGIGCWVALLIVLMLFTALARMFIRRREISAQHSLLAMTATVAIVLGMMLNVFLGQILVRYFIVGTLLLVTVLFVAMKTEPCRNKLLHMAAPWFVIGCLAFVSVPTLLYDWNLGRVNYEMAADWLVEHGYTQGYATFWNANTIVEASDGRIEMWVLADSKRAGGQETWTDMKMQYMLQNKSHLTQDPEGKVFLLVDEEEYAMGSPLLNEDHLVDMIAWSYYVYEYDSVQQMRALLKAE